MSKKSKPEGIVYSTNPDFKYNYNEENEEAALPPEKQKLRVVLDTKSRAGKTVTLITGFTGTADDLNHLAKNLKNKLGTGGSVKDKDILIQGDFRIKVTEILKKEGFQVRN